jgi:hypothetical protein
LQQVGTLSEFLFCGITCQSHITTDGQSISQSWCQAPSGAQAKIFVIVRYLPLCRCGTPPLTRGRICHFLRSQSADMTSRKQASKQ